MHENEQLATGAQAEQDDQWLDEVLSQTFPASDPVPWRHKEAATSVVLSNARNGEETAVAIAVEPDVARYNSTCNAATASALIPELALSNGPSPKI